MSQLRILVADDNQFMRTAYKRILDTQDGFEVVGTADGTYNLDIQYLKLDETIVTFW